MYYLVIKVASATTLEIWEKLISGPNEEVTMKWAKNWLFGFLARWYELGDEVTYEIHSVPSIPDYFK